MSHGNNPTHPRPQLRRDSWIPLDGDWEFALDPDARWHFPKQVVWDRTICLPFAPETDLSGVREKGFYKTCWYRRVLAVPPPTQGGRWHLHFGAVDYAATVWANGREVARHEGGYTPFTADLTPFAGEGEIEVVVRAEDDPHDLAKPRGKQDWQLNPHSIWYPRTTGIWQPVWLESIPATSIARLRWTPTLERYEVGLEAWVDGGPSDDLRLRVVLKAGPVVLADDTYRVFASEVHRRIALSDPGIDDYRNELLWSPDSPTLIRAHLQLLAGDGATLDEVWSYTALRSIAVQGDRFVLNGRPLALRLVLDQGYWPGSGQTAPDDAALRRDVELAKAMGFNGVRKHQKIEDPRYLYWADALGLLVWEEMPSAYRFTPTSVERLTREWAAVIERDRGHPCIVAWVPFNESWGVPDLPDSPTQRHYVQALYHLTKTLDPTRPVVGNDGWESVATDIIGIHDYDDQLDRIASRYGAEEALGRLFRRERPGGRMLILGGDPKAHPDHPVVLTEFGGIAYSPADGTWGYSRAGTAEDFAERYSRLLLVVRSLPLLAGFCYTQFADTYQEANGLLFADRTPKFPLADMARATRGPTKVLEYMAAGKPIVSTRIADIVGPYAAMVGLGDDPEEFLDACGRALAEAPTERGRRLEQYRDVLSRTSWDKTVEGMAGKIESAVRDRIDPSSGSDAGGHSTGAGFGPPVVVIGAGPTGLSAAYHLGEDALLLEANATVGGWCRSLVDNGFTFDWAGHIMFSNDPYVHEMYELLLGDNVHWQNREAWIYSKSVYTRYPFQGSLYGLPAEVIKECIVGAIESRFGGLSKTPDTKPAAAPSSNGAASRFAPLANGNGHANGTVPRIAAACSLVASPDPKDAGVSDCCGDGVAESTIPKAERNGTPTASGEPKNFEEFIYKVWGAGIARHFAIPYNEKIWAVPLADMETSWLGGRVPMPDLAEMIEGALTQKPKAMGPNARFGYPLRGGFQALMNGFLPHLKGELHLDARVASVSVLRRVVTLRDGSEFPYEQLVSTMPLPALIRALGDEAPDDVKRAAAGLRHTSVRCVNIGVGRENLTDKHWIYYPEETVFHRIFVQGNASPHCNPPGGFGLTCEITYGPLKPLSCDGPDLVRRCIDDCIKVGILRAGDPILAANQVDMPCAYVVYDHARPKNVALIRAFLDRHDIHLAGRYSEWEYYNSDHAFLAGKKVAEAVRERANSAAFV